MQMSLHQRNIDFDISIGHTSGIYIMQYSLHERDIDFNISIRQFSVIDIMLLNLADRDIDFSISSPCFNHDWHYAFGFTGYGYMTKVYRV